VALVFLAILVLEGDGCSPFLRSLMRNLLTGFGSNT